MYELGSKVEFGVLNEDTGCEGSIAAHLGLDVGKGWEEVLEERLASRVSKESIMNLTTNRYEPRYKE